MTITIDPTPEAYETRPFPVGVLPQPIRDFVRQGAAALACDPCYIALPTLVAVASSIGLSSRVRIKSTWGEYPILWAALVGVSGSMKTPALKLAFAHLFHYQGEAFKAYEQEREEYRRAMLRHEQDLQAWKRSGHKSGAEPPAEPQAARAVRHVVSDITVEALAPILQANPRGVAVNRDELTSWIGAFGAYKQGRGGDAAKWLEMHQAGPLLVDRKGGEPLHVARAGVSLIGGIQPERLTDSLGREHFENGLAARLLIAMPQRQVKQWTDRELPAETDRTMSILYRRLLALPFNQNAAGDLIPVDFPLSPDGRKAFINFYQRHADEQSTLSGDLASVWSKLEAYCARFALIDHIVRMVMEDPTLKDHDAVGAESVACAEQLVRWFGAEATRIYAGMHESDEQRRVRDVVEMARARGAS